MKNRSTYQLIFFRLLLILFELSGIVYCLVKSLHYTAVFIGVLALITALELFVFIKNAWLFYDRTIASILQNDFSSDFSKLRQQERYKSLLTLYEFLKDKQNEEQSRETIYRSLLNALDTGILILSKENSEWRIFLMNDFFSSHFKVPKVTHWKYLKSKLPGLCALLEQHDFGVIRTTLQIRVNQLDTQTFTLQASQTKTFNNVYYVVMLDSVQKVIEKKEKEAWINLMKVISHELLNSLTPIRSLSQNLKELVHQDELSPEDLEDMRQSLSTMLNRSNHLQEFVESYRKLASMPSPVKETVSLKTLLENSITIMKPLFKAEAVTLQTEIPFDRRLYVDAKQLEQVLINLFTNSIYALEGRKNKIITLKVEHNNKRLFIIISDNGSGIAPEIEDKIFLPFFTTRNNGSGIGLTLSKAIVEAHGGYLAFRQQNEITEFMVCLIE